MKNIIILTLLCIAIASIALDDTPDNRAKEADRYMKTTPPEDIMKDMTEQMSRNLSPENRREFKELMEKHLNIAVISKAIKDALVKHFTADELKALADFYSSPVGKSAMKKFSLYMADVMPVIQSEVIKARTAVVRASTEINRKKENENK